MTRQSFKYGFKALKWTEDYNIHIVVVLHENPGSDKARGHIGTELMNKAETVIALEVDKYDENISTVMQGSVEINHLSHLLLRLPMMVFHK